MHVSTTASARFENDILVEERAFLDQTLLFRQMGLAS
jgi:hypothetical protein